VFAAAQFLMVLDQAVMNVAISQLVEDFDTTVTAIQGVITLYSLVMAALMITGGKIGDLLGRRRAFGIGMAIYCCGSGLTAASQTVGQLTLGWSILEGIGAALVLPALAALIAGNYDAGRERTLAYAVIGGVAGAGIAVGPILGGWATTELSWRCVFAGEVLVGLGILAFLRLVAEPPRTDDPPKLDIVGAVLCAAGMALAVLGVLQGTTWGWLEPKNSPIEPFGFALTPFVILAGLATLYGFRVWQQHREDHDQDPLVHFGLFEVTQLRAGLQSFFSQNLILMGIFFTIPLYLQLVLGLDALETGLKMLPVSVMMFLTSLAGSRLATRIPARGLVRTGLGTIVAAVVVLLSTIQPELDSGAFAIGMGLLGIGMGLLASQLGNTVQSAVGPADRSEAGGLQYTAQQLGSSLGVAFIGAIVLTGLVSNFVSNVSADDRISDEVAEQVGIATQSGATFVAASQVEAAATDAGLDAATVDALVENYEQSQLASLKVGLLVAGLFALGTLPFTKGLPSTRPADEEEPTDEGLHAEARSRT
jgi:MFS family permease